MSRTVIFCCRPMMRGIALAVLLAGFGVAQVSAAQEAEQKPIVTRTDMALTLTDYEAATMFLPKEKRAMMQPSIKQIMAFLENVMVYRVLANEARAAGMDKDPVTRKEIEQAVDKLLALKRLEAFSAAVKRPDFTAAARENYEVNKAKYTIAEGVNAEHVLISQAGRSDAEALKRAEEVHKKALAGADFAALAMEYSDDQSKAQNKGSLGFFGRGQMVKPFEEAAFALKKPGEISPVVKTQFGYHVVRLVEKRAATVQSFEEVKEKILREVEDKFVADARVAYISDIKNDKSIVIHEDVVDALFETMRK